MEFTKIKQLHNRFGFGLTPSEYQRWQTGKWKDAVDELFKKAENAVDLPLPEAAEEALATMTDGQNDEARADKLKIARQLTQKIAAHWVRRMADPEASALRERMTFFWHGHFACDIKLFTVAHAQCNTLRQHALGPFRELVLAIAKDAGMIRFLNNQQNRKNSPNENFARELLELFTIGRGNYTEQDIKEAARAFTGWSSTGNGAFLFREKMHDYGSKTFLGKTGDWNGEDIIDIILEKKETSAFLTAKIWRYFVGEKIDGPVLRELSDLFYHSQYHIGTLVRAIAEHPAFYRAEYQANRIKSPIDLLVGLMRNYGISFPSDESLVFLQRALGQVIFSPPNVAGWPGGKTWIDNSSLLLRLNLGVYLFLASDVDMKLKEEFESPERNPQIKKVVSHTDLAPFKALLGPYPSERREAVLADFLLSGSPNVDLDFLRGRAAKESDTDKKLALWIVGLMSFPEFQLS